MNIRNLVGRCKEYISDDKKRALRILLVCLLIVFAVGLKVHSERRDTLKIDEMKSEKIKNSEEDISGEIYVDVSGAVRSPGVYAVPKKTRIFEAIEKAGGLKKDANIDSINRASFVEDGAKIVIPSKADSESESTTVDRGKDSSHTAAELSEQTAKNTGGKININSASNEELKRITGVGDAIAGRIIEYRNKSRFSSIEDIKNVKGIGDAKFEKMKGEITV